MTYVLDTHTLIWFISGNSRLSSTAQSVISHPASQLLIPTMVLAEANYLHARQRSAVSPAQIADALLGAENCSLYPLDELVAARISGELDLHDAIIVATALVYRERVNEEVAIVTRDEKIAQSGLIPVIW